MTIRALFYVATRHVKLAFENSTIMARYLVGLPVVLFISVTYAGHSLAVEHVCQETLCRLYFLRPPFYHWQATVDNALSFFHLRELISQA